MGKLKSQSIRGVREVWYFTPVLLSENPGDKKANKCRHCILNKKEPVMKLWKNSNGYCNYRLGGGPRESQVPTMKIRKDNLKTEKPYEWEPKPRGDANKQHLTA